MAKRLVCKVIRFERYKLGDVIGEEDAPRLAAFYPHVVAEEDVPEAVPEKAPAKPKAREV